MEPSPFKDIQLSIDNPSFYAQVFSRIVKEKKEKRVKDEVARVCEEEYNELTKRLESSEIQEGTSVRNVLKAQKLAHLLIDEEGNLDLSALKMSVLCLKENLYPLGPERQHDAYRQEHLLKVLEKLQNSKDLQRQLKLISRPYLNPIADQIIRETLLLAPNTPITDAHTRRAALSAWLTFLRQNVGSCFATAPAIIIHGEDPSLFLKDLSEMLGTGRLKRTFGGVEYSVPISITAGSGDFRKLVQVSRRVDEMKLSLWRSPGLILALETIDILPKDKPLIEKIKLAKEHITKVFASWRAPGEVFYVSIEEIIREILLSHLNLTQKDIVDYLKRPQEMIYSGLLLQVHAKGKKLSKGDNCRLFLQQMELAKNAFISLADNALLKAWEFTIASFSETKSNFSRWNLYTSLGLRSEDAGGIGPRIIEIVQYKLNMTNQKVESLQLEYEQVYAQVKYLEGRIRKAEEKEIPWLKAEYQSRGQEFYTLEELRNKTHRKAKLFANLFNILIDIYYELFPDYFQEVYDADIRDMTVSQYDDSPAGFRLLYKHGRSNTSMWTRIYTPQEFVSALASFFSISENQVLNHPNVQGVEEDVGEIITDIVTWVKTLPFLESTLFRMALTHQGRVIEKPLENLDKIDKKPWVYTSGGTMDTLVSCYFRRDQKPATITRWVESEIELAGFLIDTMKGIPYKLSDAYAKDSSKSLLMHSPTHAFLLKPGNPLFKEGWSNESLAYIWLRDELIFPMENFLKNQHFSDEMIEAILVKIKDKSPFDFQARFVEVFQKIPGKMNTFDLHRHVVEKARVDPILSQLSLSSIIDATLYEMVPLFPSYQLREKVEKVAGELSPAISSQALLKAFDAINLNSASRPIGANELQQIVESLVCLVLNKTFSPINFQKLIRKALVRLGYCMPAPLIFADTNWVKEEFGFTVNPGTYRFELWCFDSIASRGFPMVSWAHWMNGSRKDALWGVYNHPQEYSGT